MNRLTLGPLLNDTIIVSLKSLPRLILLGLMYSVIWGLGFYWMSTSLGITEETFSSPEENLGPVLVFFGILTLLSVPFGCGALLDAHARLLGRRYPFRTMLRESFASSPRAIVVALCAGLLYLAIYLLWIELFVLAGVLGNAILSILIAVGGSIVLGGLSLVLYSIWCLVPATCVIERRMASSFQRSAVLTRGNRLILFVAIILVSMLSTTVYMSSSFMVILSGALVGSIESEGLTLAVTIVGFLLLSIGLLLSFCVQFLFPVVAFVKLRELKEGGETEDVASVFR